MHGILAKPKEQTIVGMVSQRRRREGGRPSLHDDGGEGCPALPGLLLFDGWGPEGGAPKIPGQQFSACLLKCLSVHLQ